MKDPADVFFDRWSSIQDAETSLEIHLEGLEEEIKSDPEEKARLALLYIEDHEDEFLDWAAHQLFYERTPQWKGGWSGC